MRGIIGIACASLALAGVIGVPAASADPAAQPRLSPRLAALADRPSATGALSLADSGPGSLVRTPAGRVLVYVTAEADAGAAAAAVRRVGGAVVNVADTDLVVTAFVDPSTAPALAADPSVRYVRPVLTPYVRTQASAQSGVVRPRAVTCTKTPTSEGDALTRAAEARAAFGVDGTGTTIGVISNSYNRNASAATTAADDVASGNLPGAGNPCGYGKPVIVVDDRYTEGDDEGRAMMQIAHDLAPGAGLAFATGFLGQFQMAANIRRLASPGLFGAAARVIVDDVFYYDDPFFQQGALSRAIEEVSEAGVTYVTVAGNHNLVLDVETGGGQTVAADVASWEAPEYRPVGWASCGIALDPAPTDCLDFDPASAVSTGRAFTLANQGTASIALQWAEPFYWARDDLDLVLVSTGDPGSPGSPVVRAVSRENNSAARSPSEFVQYTNDTGAPESLSIMVVRNAGSTGTPRVKVAFLQPTAGVSDVAFPLSAGGDIVGPTVYGHAGSPRAITVAAQAYDEQAPEPFSSRGPMTTYFLPVPSVVPTTPMTIGKPDITATDGVSNTFLGPMGTTPETYRFYGTSAAAPHVAAVVALLNDKRRRDLLPGLPPRGVKALLKSRATSIPLAPPNSAGAGYVDAMMTLATRPLRPRPPTGTPGDSAVQLTWTAGRSGGLPVDSYEVQSTPAGAPCTSTTTSATCTGLTNGQAYTFTVRQHTALGWSPRSFRSTAITPRTVPSAPTAFAATPGDSQVSLAWAAPASTGGAPITQYRGVANPSAQGATRTCTSTATTCTITGLVNGVSYRVRVRAVNVAGLGVSSAYVARVPYQTLRPTWSRSGRTVRATFPRVSGASSYRFVLSGATTATVPCTTTAQSVTCSATLLAGTTDVRAQALLPSGGVSARGNRGFTL